MAPDFPPTPRSVLEDLLRSLDAEFSGMARSLPGASLKLLEEAVVAYEAGAYDSTALTCRSSLEAACWHYLHLTWNRTGWASRDVPRDRNLDVAQTHLTVLREAVFRQEGLSAKDAPAFDDIKDAGDTTAHIAERTLRADEAGLREWVTRPEHPPADSDPLEPAWVTDVEASSLIVKTASLVGGLFAASARRSRTELPDRF